jgi:hypothetical protein
MVGFNQKKRNQKPLVDQGLSNAVHKTPALNLHKVSHIKIAISHKASVRTKHLQTEIEAGWIINLLKTHPQKTCQKQQDIKPCLNLLYLPLNHKIEAQTQMQDAMPIVPMAAVVAGTRVVVDVVVN